MEQKGSEDQQDAVLPEYFWDSGSQDFRGLFPNLPTDVNVLLKMQGLLGKHSAHSPSMVSTFLSISEINEEGWQKDKEM